MNPVIPVLVLITCALVLVRRKAAVAIISIGVAGMLLLSSALSIPTGVVSNADILHTKAPWQTTACGTCRVNPEAVDQISQFQPWLMFLRDEIRAGRLPLWNSFTSAGLPFWSFSQGAPLFPLNILFVGLPVLIGLTLVIWLAILIAGLGTYALALELGLGIPGAVLAALIFSLCGTTVSHLGGLPGNAFVLMPWILWSVERIANRRGGWLELAGLGAMQVLAGHPESVILTGLVTFVYLLVRGTTPDLGGSASTTKVPAGGANLAWTAWAAFSAGWLVALALSAVCFVPTLLAVFESAKWSEHSNGIEPEAAVLLKLIFRLVLPDVYGNPSSGTWWGPFNSIATAAYVGIAPLVMAASGMGIALRDRRWLAITVLFFFCLLTAYHLPGPYQLLHSLPPFNRVLLHRLLFGMDLSLALLAGAGFARWLDGQGRRSLSVGCAHIFAVLVLAWGIFASDWEKHGLVADQVMKTTFAAVVVLLLACSLAIPIRWRQKMRHLILVCVAGDLLWMHSYMVAAVPLEHFYPITESVAFLQKQSERIAGIGGALLPNASVVYRIPDIRGYDPMVSARFANAYKKLSGVQSLLLQPIRNWTHPLLDQLSVRWVLSPPKQPAPVDDWRLAFQGQDARVYERVTALPMVRWSRNQGNESSESQRISVQKSSSQFTVVERVPGRWVIDWSCTDSNRLEICEIFHEGWYASNDGRPVSVEPVEDLIIGIPLQAGHGRIRLEFWPPGLNLGLLVSSLALLVFATGWLIKLGKFR